MTLINDKLANIDIKILHPQIQNRDMNVVTQLFIHILIGTKV